MVLRDGILFFSRRLLDEGNLGTLGSPFIARFCALRGGDDEGISTPMVRVLRPMVGTDALVGSLHFLDGTPCSALAVANDVLHPGLDSNSRGGGNVDGEWECEPCGDETFSYLFAILCFSP